VARKLQRVGIKTALITLAGEGCLGLQGSEVVRVHAPEVEAVDGCGAGATFSSGFIYAYLHGWPLAEALRFATSAASLKVTRVGYEMFAVDQIMAAGAKLKVEQWHLAAADLGKGVLP
jgi:sugar/nucleoside kinase (ribokinase family)